MSQLTAVDPWATLPGPTGQALRDLRAAALLVEADAHAGGLLSATAVEPAINAPLATWLYARWWVGHQPRTQEVVPTRPQVAALEVGRRLAADVERDFVVLAADDTRVVAACALPGAGSRIVQRAADAVVGSSRPGMPARPGDLVDLVAGASNTDADGVWWWVHCSEAAATQEPVTRWYLNVSAESAPAAVRAVVQLARISGVPLSLKCPVDPAGYARSDAMVVYGPRAAVPDLAAHLPSWLAAMEPLVGSDSPPMTRPLAPGVATAEDPGGGVSYGQLRCAQVAAALAKLCGSDGSWNPDPVAGVAALAQVGIDAARFEQIAAVRS